MSDLEDGYTSQEQDDDFLDDAGEWEMEEEHDEDFEDMPASKLTDPSARFPADAADAIKGIVKSKDAKSLCHEKARKRLDLPSVLEALEKLLSSSPAPVEDAPQPVAPEPSTATPQPTPTLLLREIGKAAVTDPQEEAERRLQHYAAKGFNDFMRMLERRYGTAPPEKEFEKVRCISHLARTHCHPLSPLPWQLDYWREAKGMPASLHDQLHRLRMWRNAAEHRDAQRWRREGPKSDAEFNEVLERIKTGIQKLEAKGL